MKKIKLVILIACLSIGYAQAQNYFIYAENGNPISFSANEDIQYVGLVDNVSAPGWNVTLPFLIKDG